MKEYEKIKTGHRLRPTTQDLLHLIYEYGRLHNIKDFVTIYSADNQFKELQQTLVGYFSFISIIICSCLLRIVLLWKIINSRGERLKNY